MLNAAKMTIKNTGISIQNQFFYLQNFITSPRTMGTLMPSSPWLCHAMLSQIDWTTSLDIAELGAADGVLTRRILSRMRADARLEAFEIQPAFVRKLNQMKDSRLQVMAHSAEHMSTQYDAVFSCLPLLSMPLRTSIRILQSTRQQLKEKDGVLVLFQYSQLSEKLLSRYFTWKKIRVVKNFPPALVYICKPR
ncbi:class I SAM-dependent methyltransferase [Rahnella aquatilis]|uniref:Phospholipid N-methyltransferase n=1 Tax=Rahnella aquatilis (strain ATCC 33071 / DSM 4594 / JCM 1683 / NBRC 105701 / NCIMB 13365 / CIP 78.65) TaxID=745277 RepID=H2IZP4_RAHAC|nr:methyltransferase [Rahnella aquatilis]AEX53287.1 phospholipid N-methyltransferase [Rahnella aquatilis CIP 78.65 = ATCC 33071]KFD03935.1 methyltransferase [Rahnella aquatilis CIP 78.65 = ATCC 33071]